MEEKTYSQIKKEFIERYTTVLLPVLQGYEQERKTRSLQSKLVRFFCILLIIIFVFVTKEIDITLIATVVTVVFGVEYFFIKKQFENKIKNKIMPAICRCFGDLKWSCGVYEDTDVFSEAKVVKQFNMGKVDDVFKGLRKDVEFEIIETELINNKSNTPEVSNFINIKNDIKSSEKQYSPEELMQAKLFQTAIMNVIPMIPMRGNKKVFKGTIVKFKMNKKFNSHTIIQADSIAHTPPAKNLEHTELEDVVFEKQFDVFTNDPIDARYLITTAFMERINNLESSFNLPVKSAVFYKEYFFIAFESSRDMFDIGINTPLTDTKQVATLFDEIMSVYKLIDYFKLDKKIGI